jgi:hypothetical protein
MGRLETGLVHLKATKVLFGVVVLTPMPFVLPLAPLIFLCKLIMAPLVSNRVSVLLCRYLMHKFGSYGTVFLLVLMPVRVECECVCARVHWHGSYVMLLVKHENVRCIYLTLCSTSDEEGGGGDERGGEI